MTLEIETYDPEQVKIALIKKLIKDYPNLTTHQYSIKLRTSRKTFNRWVKKYKIQF